MSKPLTPALEERLERSCEEWLQVGTRTAPADRPRAEAAIAQLYEAIGEVPPRFLWCDSPLAARLAMCPLGQFTRACGPSCVPRSSMRCGDYEGT